MGSMVVFQCQAGVWCSSFGGEMAVKSRKSYKGKPFSRGSSHLVINGHKTSNFTFKTADNVPLHHFPGLEACFDQYMDNKERIIRSIIPKEATFKQLNQDVWRIKMPVVQALFFRVQPVIDVDIRVKTKSNSQNYPSHIPSHITKLFEARTTNLELEGLPTLYMPPLLYFEATGILYPQTQGSRTFVMNQLNADISIVFPTLLSWIPDHVLGQLLNSIIQKVVDDMRRGYTVRLQADYRSFQRSKSKNSV